MKNEIVSIKIVSLKVVSYICKVMSKFEKQQKERQEKELEDKEASKIRKEKLAGYLYSMSNTLFGSLVIGAVLVMLDESAIYNEEYMHTTLVVGFFIMLSLAKAGDNILKKKRKE